MSADNGIYILKLKDQCRVVHAQAIDNINWHGSVELNGFNPTEVVSYFEHGFHGTYEECQKEAFRKSEEISNDDWCPILEYGICLISELQDFTWEDIIKLSQEERNKSIR